MARRLPSGMPYNVWELDPGQPNLRNTTAATERMMGSTRPTSGTLNTRNVIPSYDGFEPQADGVLRPSAQHLAEKIFKKLIKLRKKAFFRGACFRTQDVSRVVTEERRTCTNEDAEMGYDSEENSFSFVSTCDHPDTPSSSSSLGSSSFDSLGTSRSCAPPASAPHRPGSQVMANMLLSIVDDDDLEEDNDFKDSKDALDGPRESAWHQPEEEVLTEQEWRMLRSLQAKSPARVARQSPGRCLKISTAEYSSYKYPTMGGNTKRSSMFRDWIKG